MGKEDLFKIGVMVNVFEIQVEGLELILVLCLDWLHAIL